MSDFSMKLERASSPPAGEVLRPQTGDGSVTTWCEACGAMGKMDIEHAKNLVVDHARQQRGYKVSYPFLKPSFFPGEYLFLDGCSVCGRTADTVAPRSVHEAYFTLERSEGAEVQGDGKTGGYDSPEYKEKCKRNEKISKNYRASGGYVADPAKVVEPLAECDDDGVPYETRWHCRGCGHLFKMTREEAVERLQAGNGIVPTEFLPGDYIETRGCAWCEAPFGKCELRNIRDRPEDGFANLIVGANDYHDFLSLQFEFLFPPAPFPEKAAIAIIKKFGNGQLRWRDSVTIDVESGRCPVDTQFFYIYLRERSGKEPSRGCIFGSDAWFNPQLRDALDIALLTGAVVGCGEKKDMLPFDASTLDDARIGHTARTRGILPRHYIPERATGDRAIAWDLPLFSGRTEISETGREVLSRYEYDSLSIFGCGWAIGLNNVLAFASIKTFGELFRMPFGRVCDIPGIEPYGVRQLFAWACELTGAVLVKNKKGPLYSWNG
jgi:hypothetical protein